MTLYEEKEQEIATITERNISLELSDADMLRLHEKAGGVGLTISELLTYFVGDLVDGTYSHGSDERMYAQRWFERCGFEYATNKTFLRYLIGEDAVEDVLNRERWITENEEEIEELRSDPSMDDDDQEAVDSLTDEIAEYREFTQQIFSEFEEWCKDDNSNHGTYDEEMNGVRQWAQEHEQLLAAVQPPQPSPALVKDLVNKTDVELRSAMETARRTAQEVQERENDDYGFSYAQTISPILTLQESESEVINKGGQWQ